MTFLEATFRDIIDGPSCMKHLVGHGLRTANESINQRYLKNLADVADKICFGRT